MARKAAFLIVNHIMRMCLIVFGLLFFVTVLIIWFFKLDITSTGTGIIKTKDWIDVKPEVAGIIKRMGIKEGQKVKKGQILFFLEDRERRIEVETAKLKITELSNEISKLKKEIRLAETRIRLNIKEANANLTVAKARERIVSSGPKVEEINLAKSRVELAAINLENAITDHQTTKRAYSLKVAGRKELDNSLYMIKLYKANHLVALNEFSLLMNRYSQDDIQATKAEVERLKAIYDKAVFQKKEPEILQKDLQSAIEAKLKEEKHLQVVLTRRQLTRVKAPISGYVLTHDTEHMQGRAVKPGETVLRLGNSSKFIIEAKVSEVDFPLIQEGQIARVQIKPFPKGEYRLFNATVTNVGEDVKTTGPPSNLGMAERLSVLMKAPNFAANPVALESLRQSYFPVILEIEKPYRMVLYGHTYEIKPGYSVEIDIITQQERVLIYLLRRILRVKGKLTPDYIHL